MQIILSIHIITFMNKNRNLKFEFRMKIDKNDMGSKINPPFLDNVIRLIHLKNHVHIIVKLQHAMVGYNFIYLQLCLKSYYVYHILSFTS